MKKLLVMAILSIASFSALYAQDKGYLTGSYEGNSHFYVSDPNNLSLEGGIGGFDVENNAILNGDRFASNNYLKLDYYNSNFSAGIQMEAYAPELYFSSEGRRQGYTLSNLYVNWKDEDFQVTAGTFYDQLGSGLLFRSWEDRSLGINNAVMGARFAYNWENKVAVKTFWGIPRIGMGFSDTQVRGADLSVSLADIIGLDQFVLALEGSVLNKYYEVDRTELENGAKHNTYGWSGRLNFDWNGFFLKGEYVDLGQKYEAAFMESKRGNAQLVDLGYNARGLGITFTGRRVEYMQQKIAADVGTPNSAENTISYIPALCTQYTYLLTTLDPYSPAIGDGTNFGSGEIGGQIDAFYNFRRGTALGGKRGMKIHANFSTYYTIKEEGTFKPGNMMFRDFSFDVEKQWTKQFKMVLLYSMQEKNHAYGVYRTTWLSNIFVADLLYKWTPTLSSRLELQYLTTHENHKDWMAALLEVSFAPHWSIWGSDMYNHGDTKRHYYNAGVSYTKGRTRVAAGYGRYKSGYLCSGGVCRSIPQFTGANLTITTSF